MTKTMPFERALEFDGCDFARELFGPQGGNLRLISEKSGVRIESRGNKLSLAADSEEDLNLAENVLVQLYGRLKSGGTVFPQDVDAALNILSREPAADVAEIFKDESLKVSKRKTVLPKTATQREYIAATRKSDLVFCIGPAGTGKTYLAVAMAVSFLTRREVKRLILTRPAVEAGEKLGFLPGDLMEKVNPYLRPLYDALYDMLDFRKVGEMIETGVIEIAPLAFMRGRTLNDAFIILDEAQNTTPEQMKMFLTRQGFGSRVIVTGDVTQIDLPEHTESGLVQAEKILSRVKGIRFIHLNEEDVVRHPLVGRIVHAYARHSQRKKEK
ncbi:MAG: PhoH family protein [Thermodesulfobacteriota bacterium]|nr:PhoH family protein [Thermodesulfobacteriota bacterium]